MNRAQCEIFLLKVLDVIAPPYTSDFVQLFLPILENDSIAGTIRTDGEHDAVAEFIGKWRERKVYRKSIIPLINKRKSLGSHPSEALTWVIVFQPTASQTSSWSTDVELTPKKGDVKEVEDLLSDKQVLVAEAHSLEVDFSFWQSEVEISFC